MKFTTQIDNFQDTSALWGGHFIVPDDVAQHFLEQKIKRVVCSINENYTFQCALMPKGNGIYFININSDIRKKMKLKIGTKIEVELQEDTSKYGLPMPEEMDELLKIDDEGNELFHALTLGKQRSLLHIIGKPKSSDLRLKKALVVIDYLKATGGKLDFKQLNQAFKESNQR